MDFKIYVDADACPVTGVVCQVAKQYGIEVVLICDSNHRLVSDACRVITVEPGPDAVDFVLFKECQKGDVVVTQDYGLAALALGKGAYAIHQSGRQYTKDNIDLLLMERHFGKKARHSSGKKHLKGPHKRTSKDDEVFKKSFEQLILNIMHNNN